MTGTERAGLTLGQLPESYLNQQGLKCQKRKDWHVAANGFSAEVEALRGWLDSNASCWTILSLSTAFLFLFFDDTGELHSD